MKIIFIFFCLLIPIKLAFSNPIAQPQAFISELTFADNNRWVLEISFSLYGELYNHEDFDSICVASSDGFSSIRLESLHDGILLFVLTSDSLITPLSINPDGDCIKLCSYLSEKWYYDIIYDSLSFGNYPNSMFDSIPSGYSICRLGFSLFSKDKSPTLGSVNDTSGTCGILEGFIYDRDNNLITNENFALDNQFKTDENGMYSTGIFARELISNIIYKFTPPGQYQTLHIEPIYVNINPDSILVKDIHCTDYIVGIEDINIEPDYKLEIINYPNPFNSATNFFIKIPAILKHNKAEIIIYNSNGEKIFSIELSNSSMIQWKGQDFNGEPVSSGIYYYQLLLDNIVYKNNSMILLK